MITLLGQLPAPYLYGAIYNIDQTKKTAFNFTLFYSWAGALFISIGAIFRLEISKNIKKNEEFFTVKIEEEIKKENSNEIRNKKNSSEIKKEVKIS